MAKTKELKFPVLTEGFKLLQLSEKEFREYWDYHVIIGDSILCFRDEKAYDWPKKNIRNVDVKSYLDPSKEKKLCDLKEKLHHMQANIRHIEHLIGKEE